MVLTSSKKRQAGDSSPAECLQPSKRTKKNDPKPPLLALPAELRNNIFDLLLEKDLTSPINLRAKQPAITRVCRQTRREALPMVGPKLVDKAWNIPLLICGSAAVARHLDIPEPQKNVRLSVAPWLLGMDDLRTHKEVRSQVQTVSIGNTMSTEKPRRLGLDLTPFEDCWFSTHDSMSGTTVRWLELEHRSLHWGFRWAAEHFLGNLLKSGQAWLSMKEVKEIVKIFHVNRRTRIHQEGPHTRCSEDMYPYRPEPYQVHVYEGLRKWSERCPYGGMD